VRDRAIAAWTKAKLAPITLHECRHTFASFMIAATVNAKALSVCMGHSSITITPTSSAPTHRRGSPMWRQLNEEAANSPLTQVS
jgi:integrase